jgi:hypothetical protein
MDVLAIIAALFMGGCMVLYGQSIVFRDGNGSPPIPSRRGLVRPRWDYGRRIFVVGFVIRLLGLTGLLVSDALGTGISRDSLNYHQTGIDIARQMAAGYFNWPNWIDNGWFQFIGLVYYLFGTHMILIQLLNVTVGAVTGVLTYRLALGVYGHEPVARFAGYLTACFPSFVYYSLLPLKDTVSLFALLLLVLASVRLRSWFSLKHLVQIIVALLVILGLRDYLFLVCLGLTVLAMVPVSGHRAIRYVTLAAGLVLCLGSITYAFGMGFFGIEIFRSAKYFDLEYINYTRQALSRGYGGIYDTPGASQWGQGLFSDLMNLLTGVYFFFFSIDPFDIGRARQMFALPEMLLLLVALPSLLWGVVLTWLEQRHKALPILIFAFGIMAVYSSTTTNMGAMFRWRMQSLPFFLIMLAYGVYRRRKGVLFRLMLRLAR